MKKVDIPERKRQRAPSRRSLETRARILDSAERQFAERGFEGASIREIATGAGTQVGLVHHHGEGKEELFRQVVARRADELSSLRLSALEARKSDGSLDLSAIMTCFFEPYIAMASRGDRNGWPMRGSLPMSPQIRAGAIFPFAISTPRR